MRALRVAAVVVLAVLIVGVTVQMAFDREHKTLDATARKTVSSRFARLSDGTTEYVLDGPNDGRTVVLLAGASVPFYIWDSTAAALAANGFRVLRYNYYGRGFSDRPTLRYDLATYDRQLTELLDTLRIRGPVDVAGLSMGGPIAANFADRHPERVRTLTLVDPAFGNRSGTPLPLRIPGVATLAMTLGASSMANGQLDDFVHPERYPDWVSRYEVQMQYKGFRHSIMETRRGDVLQRPARSFTTLMRSSIPILLIWGKSDRTVPLSQSDSVRAAFPRAEFHVLDGAGHLPNIEQAAVVDTLMLRFLGSIPSSAFRGSAHDFEVTHHAGGVVLENVAMVHPLTRTIVGQPRDARTTLRRYVERVLPRAERRRLAIQLDELKEESM